ncbi:MAG: hypothetical protein LBD49_06375 [Oscillospiraceae bacterium]|nr:hypothetical protein [Oscillospiraceae bacterium]
MFASFIFALAIAAVLVVRFAFGGVKRRMRELSEREAALMKLYRDIEKLSSAFRSEAEELLDALRETEERLYSAPPAAPPPDCEAPLPGQMHIAEPAASPAAETPYVSRRDEVLRLAGEGLATDDIARELSITQNEVALIIGISGK